MPKDAEGINLYIIKKSITIKELIIIIIFNLIENYLKKYIELIYIHLMEIEIIEKPSLVLVIDNKKSKDAYQNFKAKNKEKISERISCSVCGGKYVYYSKSLHLKSKKHKFCAEKYIEQFK